MIQSNKEILAGIGKTIYSMEGSSQKNLMVITDYANRGLINLQLLKFFLQERKQTGVFITFDRPHQYISKLLKYNNINQEELTFVDAISLISGETSQSNGINVQFMKGPYQIGIFRNLVARGFGSEGKSRPEIELKNLDFIMIDDIAALTVYNDMASVKDFITTFLSTVEQLNTFLVALVIDANHNKEIYSMVHQYCDREVLVNVSKSTVKETWNRTKENKKLSLTNPVPVLGTKAVIT